MAQITTATTGIANMDINTLQAAINAVRARLAASRTMRAQDILDIMWVYNMWIQHVHNVTDYYYMAYGNTYAYGTTAVTRTSYGVDGASYADGSLTNAGQLVNTNSIRAFAALVNARKYHTHLIDDGVY